MKRLSGYQKHPSYALLMERVHPAWRKCWIFLLGFRKIGTDRWEFANEDFLRGKRALLKHINRRRSSQVQIGTHGSSSVEMGKHGTESELQKLRREKDLMMQEVVQLRQEHLMTVQKMDLLNQRMQSAEARQRHMVSFLAKVLQNPVFLGHLKQLKEQKEIASTRIRRRFLKQQQQHSCNAFDKLMDQQIVKVRSRSWDASASGLGSLLPDVEDSGLDPFPASNESQESKGKDHVSSQMDVDFSASDYFISIPDDVIPEEMARRDTASAGLDVSRPDSMSFASKGKEIVDLEIEHNTADYLKTFPEDISHECMFPDAVTPDCVGEEGIWNISLDAAGGSLSSDPAIWDNLDHYHAQEMEAEAVAGSCSLWDLGLHNLEEDLDIDKYVGGDSSLQQNKDEGGQQNEDCSRELGP